MRYRHLGSSGLVVSTIGLGGNNFGVRCGQQETTQVVHAALDAGINFFDTAPAYGGPDGSEVMLGHALRGERDNIVLATKFGFRLHSPDVAPGSRWNIRRELEASLRRLQTDYVDLYYLHHPDPVTPIEETLAALDELVTEGKVLYVGVCNMPAWQLVEAEWTARFQRLARFIAAQNVYNLLDRTVETDVIPVCARYGIGLVAHTPLANGLLTGKYRRGSQPPAGSRLDSRPQLLSEANFDKLELIDQFAQQRGLTKLEVAFAALLAQPAVASVIAGATSAEQVRANVAAAQAELSPADMASLTTVGP